MSVETCDSSETRRLEKNNFARFQQYIEEFHTKYVYKHPVSSREPLTENIRKSMTRNVKTSAYASLLNWKGSSETTCGKFSNDRKVFNFAWDDVKKNVSTKKPAILQEIFAPYIKSIGRICCEDAGGTCWLVTENLVITNLHVYSHMMDKRKEENNRNLPILVSFDYFYHQQTENITTLEVDEDHDPNIDSSQLDYKFLRLKKDDRLNRRVRLGQLVRCHRQVNEGLVTIMGYQSPDRELHEETCVVVQNYAWREKLQQRVNYAALHMANVNLMIQTEKYNDSLAYDTTLFCGSSGSPVFDMKANIVAMHTQNYPVLNPNDSREECSLMEFGIQFKAICEDMKRKNIAVEEYFPNYKEEQKDEN